MVQNIDLGSLLKQGEKIKAQKLQNEMSRFLAPIQQERARIQFSQDQMQQAAQEANVFLSTLGDTSGMDEQQKMAAWTNARNNHARLFGQEDADQIPNSNEW